MGRYIKNPRAVNHTAESIGIPVGGTADRSTTPSQGDFRFNTDANKLEVLTAQHF